MNGNAGVSSGSYPKFPTEQNPPLKKKGKPKKARLLRLPEPYLITTFCQPAMRMASGHCMPRVRHLARVTGRETRERKRKEEEGKKKKERAEGENLTISIMPGLVVIAAGCLFGSGSILFVVTMLQ